jgi:hypothetical protein
MTLKHIMKKRKTQTRQVRLTPGEIVGFTRRNELTKSEDSGDNKQAKLIKGKFVRDAARAAPAEEATETR